MLNLVENTDPVDAFLTGIEVAEFVHSMWCKFLPPISENTVSEERNEDCRLWLRTHPIEVQRFINIGKFLVTVTQDEHLSLSDIPQTKRQLALYDQIYRIAGNWSTAVFGIAALEAGEALSTEDAHLLEYLNCVLRDRYDAYCELEEKGAFVLPDEQPSAAMLS